MDMDIKIHRDADCKTLLREIVADVRRTYGPAVKAGLVSDEMMRAIVKATAWDKMHAVLGSHVGRAVDGLIEAIIRD